METDPRRETAHDPPADPRDDEPQHDPREDAAATPDPAGVEPRPGEGTAADDVV